MWPAKFCGIIWDSFLSVGQQRKLVGCWVDRYRLLFNGLERRMKIVLFGGTELTRRIADTLVDIGMPPTCVIHLPHTFTISYSPDAITNRRFADMADWSEHRGIEAHDYESVEQTITILRSLRPEIGIAAGWYHMLPARLRCLLPQGVIGVHASLLPKYRGNAPLNWALLQGERESGVSLFALADGMDDGLLYGQRRFPIGPNDYISDLVERADSVATSLLRECIAGIADGSLTPQLQSGTPTYCLQRSPDDGIIDWTRPAEDIERLVRAVSQPYPGAHTALAGAAITIWRAQAKIGAPIVLGQPGQIARVPEIGLPCVVTGHGLLAIEEATDEHGADVVPLINKSTQQRFALLHV